MKMVIIPILLLALVAMQSDVFAERRTHARVMSQSSLENNSLRSYTTLAANKRTAAYSGRVFVFDPRHHRWYAYSNGRLVASGVAAGGAGYCPDIRRSCRTPVGYFSVLRKGPPNCRSTRYPKPRGGARMDYCMFFTKYYAIHGSNHVPAANVSHGCVRVQPAAARWLHGNFMFIGTRVIVRSY